MDSEGIKAVAQVAKEVLPVKDAYCDALQPGARQLGKAGETVGMILNTLLLPIRHYVFNWQAKQEQLERELTAKLAEVPKERIVEQAPLHVVVPAVQAWSYSIECNELKNLYANLLANAMISDEQSSIHPGFVEVIRQMHPYEAKMFEFLSTNSPLPMVELRGILPNGTDWKVIHKHIVVLDTDNETYYPDAKYWQNLERLGLVSLDYSKRISNEGAYKKLEVFITLDELKATAEESGLKLALNYGAAEITPFGTGFADVCLKGPAVTKE